MEKVLVLHRITREALINKESRLLKDVIQRHVENCKIQADFNIFSDFSTGISAPIIHRNPKNWHSEKIRLIFPNKKIIFHDSSTFFPRVMQCFSTFTRPPKALCDKVRRHFPTVSQDSNSKSITYLSIIYIYIARERSHNVKRADKTYVMRMT